MLEHFLAGQHTCRVKKGDRQDGQVHTPMTANAIHDPDIERTLVRKQASSIKDPQ
jgi:hypothetical protein